MEQYANDASTTLDGGINDSQTTLDVVDASLFPTTGNFRIKIEDEIMKVTGVASETFTVERGSEGTTAVAHTGGLPVDCILTAEALVEGLGIESGPLASRPSSAGRRGRLWIPTDSIIQQFDDGTDWQPVYLGRQCKRPPSAASFTWVNQGGSTATDTREGLVFNIPAGGTQLRLLTVARPTPPYTLDVGLIHASRLGVNYHRAGICIYNTGDGKVATFGSLRQSGTVGIVQDIWNSVTNYNNSGITHTRELGPLFLRIQEDGTNRLYYYSADGVTWCLATTESNTNGFTNGTHVGLFMDATGTSDSPTGKYFHYDLDF